MPFPSGAGRFHGAVSLLSRSKQFCQKALQTSVWGTGEAAAVRSHVSALALFLPFTLVPSFRPRAPDRPHRCERVARSWDGRLLMQRAV